MGAAAAVPDTSRAPWRKLLDGILLFYTGLHKEGTDEEEEWTAADIRDMVDNFRRFSEGAGAPLTVGVGPGHANDPALWTRTDLPKAGEVTRVWAEPVEINGKTELGLYIDMAVTPQCYADIENGEYDRVSAEIYPEPPEGLEGGRGKALKRVAILGWEQPQLKHTSNLRTRKRRPAAYGEGASLKLVTGRVTVKHGPGGVCYTFAEVRKMADVAANSTDALMAVLKEEGWSEDFLTKLSADEALFAQFFQEDQGIGADAGGGDGGGAMADSATMTREELIAALTDLGEDPAALEAKTDDELRALYDQLTGAGGTAMSEGQGAKKQAAGAQGQAAAQTFADPAAVARAIDGAVRRGLAQINRAGREAQKARDREKAEAEARRRDAKCRTFGDEMVRVGIWTPADVDESNPRVLCKLQQLLRLDDTQARTFSEGGKEHRTTDLDAAMEEIRRQPPRKFSERVPLPAGSGEDDLARQIREYAERRNKERKLVRA